MTMDNTALDAILDNDTGVVDAPVDDTSAPSVETPVEAPNTDSFPRDYVEQLRNEAAERRVALKPFEDAFGTYGEEDRQVWFNLARVAKDNPVEGARLMKEVADALEARYAPEDTTNLPPDEIARRAAAEEVERYRTEDQERREQEELQRQATAINDKAKELGYTPGEGPEYIGLLWLAQHKTDGDLDKAHEMMEARKQSIIDAYVESKRGTPPLPPESGDPTLGEIKTPKTIGEATDAVTEWLNAQP